MIRINCISSPRNISTALMYSFREREDTSVLDEPFYAFYLAKSGKIHPGREEILASQPHDPQEVFQSFDACPTPVLYIKNMAHHMRLLQADDFTHYKTLLLIRDPRQLIASFAQIIDNPDMNDIGVRDQYDLYKHYSDRGQSVCILDSGELLKDPPGVMERLCACLGIPYDQTMLQWPPGPRPEDGVWAKYWYANVHKSTGFSTQSTSNRPLPEHCHTLYDQAMPYYAELYSHSIKA
jgi:hypothetical protein